MERQHPHHHLTGLRFLAGRLCLDFVNSVEDRAGATPEDFIASYADLVHWSRHRQLLTDAQAIETLAHADAQPATAANGLNDALALRDALHRSFLALATTVEPDEHDLRVIEHIFQRCLAHARLRPVGERFAWEWDGDARHADRLLWPIVADAIDLLAMGDLRRVKVCANPHGCGWFFYDSSKNGSRRWCSMEGCGSSIKNRRQYARRKAATRTGDTVTQSS
jgi:predicted RNA-binding Zn ribbon-like protein